MYKILNMCDFNSVEELKKSMDFFRDRFNFDGFEMIKFTPLDITPLKGNIKGYHFRFYPCWLDLYREKFDILYEELGTDKNIRDLCGGKTKEELVNFYREELKRALDLQAEYVVFHPCNVYIKESLNYNFRYSNMEVLKGVVDFLNEVFDGIDTNIMLLLENLWWPGLRLDSYEEADYLMKNIKHKNKGFLLDTGHMLNNNLKLRNSTEGVNYILESIEKLGKYKDYIYGVHLNYSMSGEYTENAIREHKNVADIDEAMEIVYPHISKVDSHRPFEDSSIIEVLKTIPVKYLIYEMICNSWEELEESIKKQDGCISGFITYIQK